MSLVVPPYPPPRYTEAEPEVSARYHYLADQQATDGEYGLYPVEIAPKGGGPGPHFHRAMSEAFFVLSGTVKLASCAARRHPGLSQRGRRADVDLDVVCSGAPREHYFEDMAKLGDMTDEERREWFIANDDFFIE